MDYNEIRNDTEIVGRIQVRSWYYHKVALLYERERDREREREREIRKLVRSAPDDAAPQYFQNYIMSARRETKHGFWLYE